MPAPLLGQTQYDIIVELGSRRKGVTAVEVSERFGIRWDAAWRALNRLVKQGRLVRTDRVRMRRLFFRRGRGAHVYKAYPIHREEDWLDQQQQEE